MAYNILVSVLFLFSAARFFVPSSSSTCSAPLGMESRQIKDSQITASSQSDGNHAASQGRLNFKAGGGKQGGWSTRPNNIDQWIQIDLVRYVNVTGIATQGRNAYHQWVTKYKLQYSDDGVNFHYYKLPGQSSSKMFDANKDRDNIVYHRLNPPIQARFIRVRPTAWYRHISMRMELYGCLANKCQKLSLMSGVRAYPSSCLSSNQRYGSNCSLWCAHGYQLSGPSSIQCGLHGSWSHQPNTVTCNDIDECSTRNGGCSHKCFNTEGSYKCTCPDSELSLSQDNKTCHAPGVDVRCNRDNMTIVIPKSLLSGIDREHLRLLDTTCKAKETGAHFSVITPLAGCATKRRHALDVIVYSNTVLEIPVAVEDVVTRVREIEMQFNCFYSKYGVVSSVSWKSNRKLVFSDEGKGNFTLSLNMFPDKRFVIPYTKDDFPVAVVLRKLLFFEVSVTSSDKQLSIIADRCYATPTQDHTNPLKYEFISEGCPNDLTVKYYSSPVLSSQRFSLEAFKFIADRTFVFVHCHVIVCNATDPDSQCAKKCPSSGRGRREASDLMTDDVYFLAQGPLYLDKEKHEEKGDKRLAKSGSSLTFLVGMILLCVSCLVVAATVLIIFKKSRDKSATMLSSGDRKE